MENNTLSLISRIREEANKLIIRKLKTHNIHGIVPSHGDIMSVLFACEKCTMQELAQKIHRTKATVTVLIDKLVKLNLVEKEKSSDDNRITYIKLSAKGSSCRPIFEKISDELNDLLFNNFNPVEIKNLTSLLEKVRQNIS